MKTIFFFLLSTISVFLYSQPDLYIATDVLGRKDTLMIGFNEGATNGIDCYYCVAVYVKATTPVD